MPNSLRSLGLATLLASVLCVLAIGPVGCGPAVPEVQVGPAEPGTGAAGTVIFDASHGEVFGADDRSELGQSSAVQAIRDAGFAVEVNRDRIEAEDLEGASGLLLAGPMVAFADEEMALIEEYVRGGGVVMLTVHVPYAISALPKRFGVQIPDGVIQSSRPLPGSDAGIFEATEIAEHALTRDVDSVLVLSSWALQATSRAAGAVVATGGETWLASHTGSPAEPVIGSFGVVAVSEVGAGTFIVVGDDAVFANVAIDEADNRQLLENVLSLMGRETRPT